METKFKELQMMEMGSHIVKAVIRYGGCRHRGGRQRRRLLLLAAMGDAALVDDDVRDAIWDVATNEAARNHKRGRGAAR